ncbi:MAG: hypothetical protein JXA11_02925 [Phycisphaerae bacterium]|nr:hypothetical protein [Phycisphaerae bacterium]
MSVVPFGGMLPGILNVMLWGSVLGYVLQVITKTADGEDAPPGWQDIGDWSDILRPVFLLLAVVVISFGPAVAWSVALSQGYVHSLRMFWILVLWGCFYFPMALTATAMMDSLSPLNPVVVLLAILRAGWMYLFACSTLAVATIGTYWLADALSEIPYLTTLISAVGSMYLLMVTGRICGLIYRLRREKLDWPCE